MLGKGKQPGTKTKIQEKYIKIKFLVLVVGVKKQLVATINTNVYIKAVIQLTDLIKHVVLEHYLL